LESSCELGNEPSGSIKCWEAIEWLHNLWPLEWYSAPHNFINYIHIYMKNFKIVRIEVFTALTMKNVVFCDVRTKFLLHRRHITSTPQSLAG
jgi:hypothetical protein